MLRAMPRSINAHWVLPGPSVPYLIVSWHNGAARGLSGHVPSSSVLRQLDVWLKSRRPLLLEIHEALGGRSPKASLGPGSAKDNEQLKKCLADAFLSGKLVAIEVPAGEQREQQGEGPLTPQSIVSQRRPSTVVQKQAASTSPKGASGAAPRKTAQHANPAAEAVTITFEVIKVGKNPNFRAGTLLLSFQANGVNVMKLVLPYGDAAKFVGLKWSTSLPNDPRKPLVVVGSCSLEAAVSTPAGLSNSSQLSIKDTLTPGPKGGLPNRTRDLSTADVTVRYSVKSIPLETFQSLPGLSVRLSAGGESLKDFHHQVVLVKDGVVTVIARPKEASKERHELSASSLPATYHGRGDARGYTPVEYDVLTTEGRHEVHLPLKKETLYRLVKGQNAYAVVAVEPDQGPVVQQEGELPLMTQQELDELLARQGIFQIDASVLQGWMSRMGSPPYQREGPAKGILDGAWVAQWHPVAGHPGRNLYAEPATGPDAAGLEQDSSEQFSHLRFQTTR